MRNRPRRRMLAITSMDVCGSAGRGKQLRAHAGVRDVVRGSRWMARGCLLRGAAQPHHRVRQVRRGREAAARAGPRGVSVVSFACRIRLCANFDLCKTISLFAALENSPAAEAGDAIRPGGVPGLAHNGVTCPGRRALLRVLLLAAGRLRRQPAARRRHSRRLLVGARRLGAPARAAGGAVRDALRCAPGVRRHGPPRHAGKAARRAPTRRRPARAARART